MSEPKRTFIQLFLIDFDIASEDNCEVSVGDFTFGDGFALAVYDHFYIKK